MFPHFSFFCRLHLLSQSPSSLINTIRSASRFVSFSTTSSITTLISNPSNQTTLHYLINSCGLSPESALKASQRIVLKLPTTNPDSVLSLFKTYGFTQSQISKLISHRPLLLLAKADKSLKPKLEYFNSIGLSGPVLGKIVSMDSSILVRDLENQIIHSINFYKRFAHTNSEIVRMLKRMRRILDAESVMGPNITILQDYGVPHSIITKLVARQPQCLRHKSDWFNQVVLQLKELGVNPSSETFWRCLIARFGMKKSLWEAKMAAYKSFGWSEDEVISLFSKQPSIMAASENKISLALDFLMNDLKWTKRNVATYATVICLSLRKRVIPRGYVLQILLSKGLIKKESMGNGLTLSEALFMKTFLLRYQHEVPDLLVAYQNKVTNS